MYRCYDILIKKRFFYKKGNTELCILLGLDLISLQLKQDYDSSLLQKLDLNREEKIEMRITQ